MTQLAQLLGRLIRERGGYFPTNDKATFDWLEEKAREIEELVRIPKYKVGDIVETTDYFGGKHLVEVASIENDGKVLRYWTKDGTWFADFPTRLYKSIDDAKMENQKHLP